MLVLIRREVLSFLNSLTGYVAIVIFLLVLGLFLWVFPIDSNILNSGYSSLDPLFNMGPLIFMFLVPAITMRSFSEEKKTGTIEMLLTKPISDVEIIVAKYMAGVILVLLSILPTLVYYYSVYQLGNPVGNIDVGGTMGSYIGLFLLGSTFVSIGIFSSVVSDNQVVAFVIAVFLSFFIFMGFELLASFDLFGSLDYLVLNLGMREHFISMGYGAIDSRDLLYFLTIIFFFLLLTKGVLNARKW